MTGKEFDVTVRVDTSVAISGLTIDVSFNPSQLTFITDSEYGTAFPEIWIQSPDTGKITETRSTGGSAVSGNKVVITYRFKAIASSGKATIEATGKANANNTELALTKATLAINITPPVAPKVVPTTTTGTGTNTAGTNTATGTTGQSDSSQTTGDGQTAEQASNKAAGKPDSVDIGGDPEDSGKVKSASAAVSRTLSKIPGVGTGSKLPLAIIVGALLLLVGGTWFGLRAHKRAQNVEHFPDLPTTLPAEPRDIHATIFSQQPPDQTSPQALTGVNTLQQPVQAVAGPVIIRPQIVVPTAPVANLSITPLNTPSRVVVAPQGSTINPDETPTAN